MAIYHFTAQAISRSSGRSATAAAAYRAGERIEDKRTGLVFDYGKKSGVEYTEIMTPANAPDWASNRAQLWNAVEFGENRKDSQLCREVEVALPIELNNEQQLQLLRGFVQKNFVDEGMVADLAIHRPKAENPHCHILLTMRHIGPEGFGQKNRNWNDKKLLEKWREHWAEHTNRALETAGHSARVDHRTLEAQGIDRLPQVHLGPHVPEMEKRGIRTERGSKALDIESQNERITNLVNELEAIEHERHHENSASTESRADSRGNRTPSPSFSEVGRPSQGDTGGTEHISQGPSEYLGILTEASRVESRTAHSSSGDQLIRASDSSERAETNTGGTPAAGTSANKPTLGRDLHGSDELDVFDSARDRVAALANMPPAKTGKPDLSYLAARRQLKAMGAEYFEIGVRSDKGMLRYELTASDVLKHMGFFKSHNARGADIYVRPLDSGVVLLDDLTQAQVERMKEQGYEPASVVETSPQNFQAWVKLSASALPPPIATAAARHLATQYEGDPNSADFAHFGRLAGFTNTKPQHRTRNGRSPYVMAHESSGRQAQQGMELVNRLNEEHAQAQAKQEKEMRLERIKTNAPRFEMHAAWLEYRRLLKPLVERFGASIDMSRADFMVTRDLLKRFSSEEVAKALLQESPALTDRKAGHEQDYAERTVKAAQKRNEADDAEAGAAAAAAAAAVPDEDDKPDGSGFRIS